MPTSLPVTNDHGSKNDHLDEASTLYLFKYFPSDSRLNHEFDQNQLPGRLSPNSLLGWSHFRQDTNMHRPTAEGHPPSSRISLILHPRPACLRRWDVVGCG